MIEAKDLRIGNILIRKGKLVKVVGVFEDELLLQHEDYDAFWDFLSSAEPVPLTPEILGQCGFKKVKLQEIDTGFYEINNISKYGRWITKNGFISPTDIAKPFLRYDGLVDIYYLHQLQNLFYSLTGEELNFLPLLKNTR